MSLFDSIKGGRKPDILSFKKDLRAAIGGHRLGNGNTEGAVRDFIEFLQNKKINNDDELHRAVREYGKECGLTSNTQEEYYRMMIENDEAPEEIERE